MKAEIDRQAESRKEQGAEKLSGTGMLVIDYLQLMRSDQEYESRTQEVSAFREASDLGEGTEHSGDCGIAIKPRF